MEQARGQVSVVGHAGVPFVQGGADDDPTPCRTHRLHGAQRGGDGAGIAPGMGLPGHGLGAPNPAVGAGPKSLHGIAALPFSNPLAEVVGDERRRPGETVGEPVHRSSFSAVIGQPAGSLHGHWPPSRPWPISPSSWDKCGRRAPGRLRKLINGEISSRSRVNVVENSAFSAPLEEAIARYHTNAITTAEVLQELIELAKDISVAHLRGEEEGLTQEEVAFYDALAQNESAVEVMGDDRLRVIAHELLNSLRNNVSVDWQHRESTRARMRVLVKRILRKYGYPPDLQDAAVQTVLQQAEALSARWAG